MQAIKMKRLALCIIGFMVLGAYASTNIETNEKATKQKEINFELRGNLEACEVDYDKCAGNCEIKSKTEKAFDTCMEACESKYDLCYDKAEEQLNAKKNEK